MSDRAMRDAVMDPNFLEDLGYWTRTDVGIASRILSLVEATLRDPFRGLGKPEPLRGPLTGNWSRRINKMHRLVYTVDADRVYFVAARYHP